MYHGLILRCLWKHFAHDIQCLHGEYFVLEWTCEACFGMNLSNERSSVIIVNHAYVKLRRSRSPTHVGITGTGGLGRSRYDGR